MGITQEDDQWQNRIHYFSISNQCSVIPNSSTIYTFNIHTLNQRSLLFVWFNAADIKNTINDTDLNKGREYDKTSIYMLKMCESFICKPLESCLMFAQEKDCKKFTRKVIVKMCLITGQVLYFQFLVKCLKDLHTKLCFSIFLKTKLFLLTRQVSKLGTLA